MNRLRFLLALISAGSCTLLPSRALDQTLGQELESIYANYRQALTQQNTTGWLKLTSRYRQMCLRNQVVSTGLSWPRAVFDLALKPPSFGSLKMIDAVAIGDTARLTYFGQIDFGIPGEAAPENVLVVWFLKESGVWKYNTIQYVNLNNDPEQKKRIAGGDKTFLQMEEFRLTGQYPAVPVACEVPYYVARLAVSAQECKATINVNGVNSEVFDREASSRVVNGGLRKGPNKISITATPTATAKAPGLTVELFIPTGNPAKPERQLYVWKWEPGKSTFPHEATIWTPSKVAVGP
jgi:hypothetical protein